MGFSKIITWAMLKGMVMKGSAALHRMDEHSRDAMGSNEALLMQLLKDNSNTEYGKKYGFSDIHSIREYQERVPFTTYDDYAPYIERMVKNREKNLGTSPAKRNPLRSRSRRTTASCASARRTAA